MTDSTPSPQTPVQTTSQSVVFIDLETTGLNPAIHAPIAIAAVVLGGPNHDARFHRRMRPFNSAIVDSRALDVNGYTPAQIATFDCPEETCLAFCAWIESVVPRPQLVVPGGYNYQFDERFLREWITRYTVSPGFYGNTFSADYVECMREIKAVWPDWRTRFPNMKLTTQYEFHFGRPHRDAHTELADCLATRDLFLRCDARKPCPQFIQYHPQLNSDDRNTQTTSAH